MLEHKALLAISLFAMGGAATGTAAYFTEHPRALTHVRATAVDTPKVTIMPLRAAPEQPPVVVETPPTDDVLMLEPVVITSRTAVRLKAIAAAQKTTTPEPARTACSEWHGLETGPEGRRVRMLCP